MQIYKTKKFLRFARKHHISDQDLIEAIYQAEQGLIDANLGRGVIKQRLAKQGQGKSSGYRTIVFYKMNNVAFFAHGFEKSDQENITQLEELTFKLQAKIYLGYTTQQIATLLETGQIYPVRPI